jgi:hypothetical protein
MPQALLRQCNMRRCNGRAQRADHSIPPALDPQLRTLCNIHWSCKPTDPTRPGASVVHVYRPLLEAQWALHRLLVAAEPAAPCAGQSDWLAGWLAGWLASPFGWCVCAATEPSKLKRSSSTRLAHQFPRTTVGASMSTVTSPAPECLGVSRCGRGPVQNRIGNGTRRQASIVPARRLCAQYGGIGGQDVLARGVARGCASEC